MEEFNVRRKIRETVQKCHEGKLPFSENDDIVEYPNAVAASFCAEMIQELKDAPDEKRGKFGLQTGHSIELMFDDPLQRRIFDELKPRVEELMRYYMISMPLCFDRVSIARYGVGDFHKPHIDVVAKPGQRVYTHSLLLFLSDAYVGGELEFYRKNTVVLGEVGKLVMFPATFSFVHGVNPVLVGERNVLFTKLTLDNTDEPSNFKLQV